MNIKPKSVIIDDVDLVLTPEGKQVLKSVVDVKFPNRFNYINTDGTFLIEYPQIKYLDLGFWFNSNIEFIKEMTNLKRLKIGEEFDQSLEPLKYLVNLEELIFDDHNRVGFEQDLTPLAYLYNLRTLIFPGAQNEKLSFISLLRNLEVLKIWLSISDIDFLIPIVQNLRVLEITLNKSESTRYEVFNGLTNIEELAVNGDFGKFKILNIDHFEDDLAPIVNLSKLEQLRITCGDKDISPLSQLTNLTQLDLSYDGDDFTPLGNLPNLRSLDLSYFGESPLNLTSLNNLQQLEKLKIVSIMSFDLSQIPELINLRYLELYSSDDMTPIFNFTKLENIKLKLPSPDTYFNQQLMELPNIKVIDIYYENGNEAFHINIEHSYS